MSFNFPLYVDEGYNFPLIVDPGVEHVGGSLLDFIPSGDAILMKVCTHIRNRADVIQSFNSGLKFLYHTDVDSQLWNFKFNEWKSCSSCMFQIVLELGVERDLSLSQARLPYYRRGPLLRRKEHFSLRNDNTTWNLRLGHQ